MDQPIYQLLFYIASGIIGFLLCLVWLYDYKKKFNELEKLFKNNKDSTNRLINEYSEYKTSIDEKLSIKDQEIIELNKKLVQNTKLFTQNSNPDKWKNKFKNLEDLFEQYKLSKEKSHRETTNKLKIELLKASEKLRKKDALLMNAKKEAFPKDNSKEINTFKKKIEKLKLQIVDLEKNTSNKDFKKLIKKNKKLKKKLRELSTVNKIKAEKIEYVETLDVKKLLELIESGELLKRRKSVVLSRDKN